MKWRLFLAAYFVGGCLTYGYSYNSSQNCGPKPSILDDEPGWRKWMECTDQQFRAPINAFYWPFYWGGTIGIELTDGTASSTSATSYLGREKK